MQNASSHVVRETVRSESNRPGALRDQKVLPEVRNRPLLLREFFSSSNFELPAEIPFESSAEIPPESPAEISFELPAELNPLHLETHFEI